MQLHQRFMASCHVQKTSCASHHIHTSLQASYSSLQDRQLPYKTLAGYVPSIRHKLLKLIKKHEIIAVQPVDKAMRSLEAVEVASTSSQTSLRAVITVCASGCHRDLSTLRLQEIGT
jgi:hypothetical protein